MYIIIVGAGEVGSYLAEVLLEEGHDVAIIESDEKLTRELDNRFDALIVHGTGINKTALEQAGIQRADLVLAVTHVDEVNLVTCMTAVKFGRNPQTVARVRDVQYLSDDSALGAQELGLGRLVNPESSIAGEVLGILNYDGSGEIHPLCDDKVALLELPVSAESPLTEEKLANLGEILPQSSLVAAITGPDGLFIPTGSDKILPESRAYILTALENIDEFWILSGKPWHHVQHVLIIGCGQIGFHLAKKLEVQGFRVTIIEKNEERAAWVSHQLRHAIVLHADGTNPEFLRQQLNEKADAVVVLLKDEEKSVLVGLFAKHLGAKKVIVRNDKPAYAPIGHKMGLDALLSPKKAVADEILRFVRRGRVSSSLLLGDHEAEILELEIPSSPKNKILGIPLEELKLPKHTLVGAIVRQEEVIIPTGKTEIMAEDNILVVTHPQDAADVAEFFS